MERRFVKREAKTSHVSNSDYMEVEEECQRDKIESQKFTSMEDLRSRNIYVNSSKIDQAPVVQRADNFIHWIGRYPADKMCARFS